MLTKIEAVKRFHFKEGWLNTYHLFSFADYFDPENLQFGTLRVFNDDTIDAYSGFGDHGHSDMEIVTIIHEGELTHRDSMGNKETINAGEVQRMTAGTGVVHAEKNLADQPVHLYQIWFLPEAENLAPGYEQKDFSYLVEKNILTMVASQHPSGEAIKLQADATIYLSELEEGKTVEHHTTKDRGVFVYVREGDVDINGVAFSAGDQARITDEETLTMIATKNVKMILIDVAIT
ncbi:MAG: pirin family protein [Patescibacteria group bacterium]|jgi:hypothetical protein